MVAEVDDARLETGGETGAVGDARRARLHGLDPALVPEVAQPDGVLRGLGVVFRQRDVQRVDEQVVGVEALPGSRCRPAALAEGDREIHVARAQPLDAHPRAGLQKGELDTRVSVPEHFDRLEGERRRDGRKGAHPEPAGAHRCDRFQLGLGGGEVARDRLRPVDGDPAGVREPEPARRAFEEPDPDLPLQLGHLARHGGLGEEERLRGFRERAVADDFSEKCQAARVEHYRSV